MTMKNNAGALAQLLRRNLKVFLLDRAAVFFSLLAPLIVLLLFVLFLGEVQVEAVQGTLKSVGIVAYEERVLQGFVNSWMMAGVMAVACITVSVGANTIMVHDRATSVRNDFTVSPVKNWVVTVGYFLYNFIVTSVICLALLGICWIYLGASGQFFMTTGEAFALIGITLISSFVSTLLTVLIATFFASENAYSAFVGIISAVVGFLIGAFMPVSLYPKAIQYLTLFFPGSYSAGLFRRFFMEGALDRLPQEAYGALEESFNMKIDFFGLEVGAGYMFLILSVFIVLLAIIVTLRIRFRRKEPVRKIKKGKAEQKN